MTVESVGRMLPVALASLLSALVAMAPAVAATHDATVILRNVVVLRAAVSGRVQAPGLVPGARFAEGDEIATIERDLYAARLADASQRLELLRDSYAEAEKAFERNEILFDEGSLALVEFDHARLALMRARAELRQAESEMAAARLDAELAVMRAPFDGSILSVAVNSGEYRNASIEAPVLATIAEQGKFAARIGIDPAVRGGLEIGTAATVHIGEQSAAGHVGAIQYGGVGDASSWTVDVYFDSDRQDIVAGMPVKVDLP